VEVYLQSYSKTTQLEVAHHLTLITSVVGAGRSMIRATALSMKMDLPKAIASMTPAFVSLPVLANDVCMELVTAF